MEKGISVEETLLPALVQSFGIILIGYVFGRTNVLGKAEAKGLTSFVQYLSLPALIFITVSTIPLTQVKWEFIAAVFIAKVFIFICVIFGTLIISNPFNLGIAGICAISATQSNDFALGYPLIVSLYKTTHPDYANYLYIIAPLQLLIFNTIGFFFLETEKQSGENKKSHVFRILRGTLKNPVVIMTVIGIVWNLTYGEKILPIFEYILKAFSSAFPATALLLVGYTMSINSEKSNSRICLPIMLLILTKSLVFPLLLQKCITLLLKNRTEKEIESFSSFGFLYGTIPTAPTVYVFASQYGVCVDIVTKTIIGSTLLSAPLMFTSASLISLNQLGIKDVTYYLSQTISYLSVINLFSCLWLLLLFTMGKRWKSISFGVVIFLILGQLFLSMGGILQFFAPEFKSNLYYAQYILTNGSIYVTRMSTFLLSVLLLIVRTRSLCFILKLKKQINITSIVICVLLPYVLAASLIVCKETENMGPNIQLGFAQIIASFVVTLTCLVGTIICVILQHVFLRKHKIKENEKSINNLYQSLLVEDETVNNSHKLTTCCDIEDLGKMSNNCIADSDLTIFNNIQDLMCDSNYHCSILKRTECSVEVSKYVNENYEIGTGLIDDEYFFKHILLLIMLGLAMTFSLFICFWKLIMEKVNGIFIELEFLDVLMNYGLGVLCFIMFGLDNRLLRSLFTIFKTNKFSAETDKETSRICKRFNRSYFNNCKNDIGDIKIIDNQQFNVFSSSDLVNWLLGEEIVETNFGAHIFINHLLKGGILEKLHCINEETVYKFNL